MGNPIRAVSDEEVKQPVVETPSKVNGLLIVVTVAAICGALSLAMLGAKRLEADSVATQAALDNMRTEITALKNQLQSTTTTEVIFLKVLVLNPKVKPKVAREIAAAVHKYSQVFKRDPDFVLAIMEIESNFDPAAVSSAGAQGLMQVMPHWKDIMAITGDLTDIETNVKAGLQVYGFYEEMYQDMGLALAAYNRGPSRVDRDIIRRRNPERNGYSDKVEAAYKSISSMRMVP